MFNFFNNSNKKEDETTYYDLIHRYYRIENHLLLDNKHKQLYDFARNKLIEYHTPLNSGYFTQQQMGEIIDFIADKFIENNANLVLKSQPQIQQLYDTL